MTGILSADRLTEEAVHLLSKEISYRELKVSYRPVLADEDEMKWRTPEFSPRIHRVTAIRYPTTQSLFADLEEVSKTLLNSVAVELGIKLCRPFNLVTYRQETFEGIDYRAFAVHDGLGVRMMRAYSIDADTIPMRFDLVVEWLE